MFIKRSLSMLRNRSVSDVRRKREEWKSPMLGSGADNLVFLDESGINIDMTRQYARAKIDERAVDCAPLNTPRNTTILSSIQLDGRTTHTVCQGGTTAERFAEYLKETLLPSLSSDDIIIMDNMRSHHAKAVKQVLDTSGIRYLYLPPYSPDFNPIEKMWSKLKTYLRKAKVRTLPGLPDAVEDAFSSVTASDCLGWFRSCCYLR